MPVVFTVCGYWNLDVPLSALSYGKAMRSGSHRLRFGADTLLLKLMSGSLNMYNYYSGELDAIDLSVLRLVTIA